MASEAATNRNKDTKPSSCTTVTENGITIKQSDNRKGQGRFNAKLSVFREFALATAHAHAKEHAEKQVMSVNQGDEDGGKRQFLACDLIAQSGIAGLQWKQHIGGDIHVTVTEQRDPQTLQNNIEGNSFTCSALPLDLKRPAGTILPKQASSEIHLVQCDPNVLMLLEAFDFMYVDPYKNPAPYFNSLFRNVRNNGVVSLVVPDTMQFARSPHVIRRSYGANCIKTGYLKELAVRIILATLATEAAKCNKAFTVLYSISMEDFLMMCVRVTRGPKMADAMLPSIGHVLHCRICEERVFYPDVMAPVEDPYSMIDCDCHKNVPGKTGVILGPLWKGSIYDYPSLAKLAASGTVLGLTPAFFTLLQRIMEDCLCDTPPPLENLKQGLCSATFQHTNTGTGDSSKAKGIQKGMNDKNGDEGKGSLPSAEDNLRSKKNGSEPTSDVVISPDSLAGAQSKNACVQDSGPVSSNLNTAGSGGVKRTAMDADAEESSAEHKGLKTDVQPAPCFFYNVHSKRLGKNHLPKQQVIVERLRSHGYRCCRTHFEKYAIRTNADLKTLTSLLGTGESKVLYVKGNQEDV